MRWEEFAAGARFRTVRLTLRHWADRDIYRRTLERFRHNPTITEWLGGSAGQWSGTEESGWRVWIERPFSYRVEKYDRWPPEEPRSVDVTTEPPYGAISTLSSEGGQSLSMEEMIEHDRWHPLFTISVHPMIAELLHPGQLPIVEHPEQPEHSTQLELVEETQFTGRQVKKLRVVIGDWDDRDPLWSENLWVADDYELLMDSETGVILRLACRADGEEFSVREMSDVAFDEPIDAALFTPS